MIDSERVAGRLAMVSFVYLVMVVTLMAGEPSVHYLHHGIMPPGAIGSRQLQRGGPLPGFFQPVEVKAPSGALISLAAEGQFERNQASRVKVGMLIGQVYRVRVTNIPRRAGMEVFPTIEIIDRLYTPTEQSHRFAIPIELTEDDLHLALQGKFVTRVIYLEDPNNALPVQEDPNAGNWFDIGPRRDPLAVADALGRPVAILRMGGRLPDTETGPSMDYLFGCPPLARGSAQPASAPAQRPTLQSQPPRPAPVPAERSL